MTEPFTAETQPSQAPTESQDEHAVAATTLRDEDKVHTLFSEFEIEDQNSGNHGMSEICTGNSEGTSRGDESAPKTATNISSAQSASPAAGNFSFMGALRQQNEQIEEKLRKLEWQLAHPNSSNSPLFEASALDKRHNFGTHNRPQALSLTIRPEEWSSNFVFLQVTGKQVDNSILGEGIEHDTIGANADEMVFEEHGCI